MRRLEEIDKVEVSAPGKIILTGEHAVVYGKRGIAAAIDKRTYVTIKKAEDKLVTIESDLFGQYSMNRNKMKKIIDRLDELRKKKEYDRIVELTRENPFLPIYVVVAKAEDDYKPLNIGIHSSVPKSAGASSSIYNSVAYGVSIICGKKLPTDEIAHIANEGDDIAHGKASGIDAFTVAHGYWTTYTMKEGARRLDVDFELPLLIVESGEYVRTGEMVAYVKKLRKEKPEFVDSVLDRLHEISNEFVEVLRARDVDRIGGSFVDYREELKKLGKKLYTPKLERICRIAEEKNAYAKPTGAWGGGICIALARQDELKSLMETYRREGFMTFKTKLGMEGLRIESVKSDRKA